MPGVSSMHSLRNKDITSLRRKTLIRLLLSTKVSATVLRAVNLPSAYLSFVLDLGYKIVSLHFHDLSQEHTGMLAHSQ